MSIKDFKKKFDPALLLFLDKKIRTLQRYNNKDLNNYLLHLRKIFQGGKRIRPYLAFLSYKAYGGKEDSRVIKLLVFIEIFHAFCLVHDDIMDDADQRHGVKTIHKFAKSLRLGKSVAILMGDYLFNWAFEILLTNNDFEKVQLERAKNIFLMMVDEVITGQFIDINCASKKTSSYKKIDQKMFLKTSSYSFIRPMMIGASLAKEIRNYKFFQDFGKNLGTAFQIQDDLFDILSDSKDIHKSSFKDVERHQHTIFTNYVFEKGTRKQREILEEYFGKKIKERDKEKLRNIFYESGAIQYGKSLINDNIKKAREILKKEKMIEEYKKRFFQLIDSIDERVF